MAFFCVISSLLYKHMQYGAKTSDYQANESLQYQAYNYIVRSHNGPQKKKNASKRCGEMEQFYVELKVLSLLSAHTLQKL